MPAELYCLADPFLGPARQIHFSRIDVGHAKIKSPAQCKYRGFAAVFLAVPSPLADYGNFTLCRAELAMPHIITLRFGKKVHA